MSQCTAKSKRSGQQCRMSAIKGKNVCRLHGGKTPSGIASPNWKTGRYSRALPSKLAQRFMESVKDPEILNMRSDIALVDARIEDLLSSTQQVGYLDIIQEMKRQLLLMQRSIIAGDSKAISTAIGIIIDTVDAGEKDLETWNQVINLLEMRRRLVEGEQKRLVAMNAMVSVEDALNLAARLLAAVKTHVEDRKILSAISDEFTTLVNFDSNEPDR